MFSPASTRSRTPWLAPSPTVLLALFALAPTALPGCARSLKAARVGQPLRGDQVLLVGEAVFVPAAWMADEDVGEMWVGFTRFPDTPVAPDRAHDEDVVLPVESGRPFVVVAPRRDLFLRSVTVAYRRQDTGGAYRTVAKRYAKCRGLHPARFHPDDQAVYLGRIVCRYGHNDSLAVEDAWDETAPQVADRIAGRRVRRLVGEQATRDRTHPAHFPWNSASLRSRNERSPSAASSVSIRRRAVGPRSAAARAR